jgi:hypothetical protein
VATRPQLSIVIGTGEGWPHMRELINALSHDAAGIDVEVVVSDGSANPVPSESDAGPAVRWLEEPGKSVFELYASGIEASRGELVALTEDHAMPRPGWIKAILAAHKRHPQAAAIGGAIENGSRDGLIEWASYFTTQGPHMAPLGERRVAMTTNEANVSYKRSVIERYRPDDGSGYMAILYNRRLADAGEELRVDDAMVVDHFETVGFGWTTAIHFHNGRTISAFRRARGMASEDWVRMAATYMLPAWRVTRVVRTGMAKGRLRRELVASVPLALWLEYVQATGHLAGYLLGPGDSPNHLR